jgi:hypothetical protein
VRFVIAIVLFVVAFLSIGYGLAQRTVLAGPDELRAAVDVETPQQITYISGETLTANPEMQTITVTGDGPLLAAYGRTSDVEAWIGETSHDVIGYDAEARDLTLDRVGDDEAPIPSAAGSDLWLGEQVAEGELTLRIRVPRDVSVLVVGGQAALPAGTQAAGEEPAAEQSDEERAASQAAATSVQVRWPVDNSTPWSSPLIVGGIVALLLGLLAFVWGLVNARRRRGPRRQTPRMPRPPKPPRLTARSQRKQAALAAGQSDRRARRRGTRGMIASAVALVPAIALAGCTSGGPISDLLGASPSPTPEASDAADEPQTETVAVTRPQFDRILERVRAQIASADEAGDAEVAAERMEGAALQLRRATYAMRAANGDIPAQPPIPDGEVEVLLPQQNDSWPRSVLSVVRSLDDTIAPQALMLVQEQPRAPYKIVYAISLEPSAEVPPVAGADVGASRLRGDFAFLKMQPDQLSSAYGDILAKDAESEFASLFQADGDTLRTKLGLEYKRGRADALEEPGVIEFGSRAGDGPVIAFGTNDTGAIVAVDEYEIETVKPNEEGAAINPQGQVLALSGKDSTTAGIVATYGLQMLFYVPSVTAEDEQIRLLGFTQGLVDAREPE